MTVHGETKGQRGTTKPRNSRSHNHDSTVPRQHPLICTGVEPIHPVHGPPRLRATSRCSEIGFTFSPFSRRFLKPFKLSRQKQFKLSRRLLTADGSLGPCQSTSSKHCCIRCCCFCNSPCTTGINT